MKTLITVLLLTIALNFNAFAQNVGINSTGAAPDASALLDLNATDKGFLITRADTANIVSPAFGLMTLAPADTCLYLFNGINWMGMGGGGDNCSCNGITPGNPGGPGGSTSTFPCNGTVIPIVDVTSPTGKIWMDRNLGSSQVATSGTDASAYGDLYQWGRCSDGHEKRNSTTTATLSPGDTPGHGDFITTSAAPNDWRNPQSNSLWQGVTGINNPCPTDYRIPTQAEFDAERLSWASNDIVGAFASPLKLTLGGRRSENGSMSIVGFIGSYSTSTPSGTTNKILLNITSSSASMGANAKAIGLSVRCIKD